MNLKILSASIVKAVHHSTDSATNLCEVVANLIRAEQKREEKIIRDAIREMKERGFVKK